MDELRKKIKNLIASGWSQMSIANAVGVGQPTIHRIINGTSAKYDVGQNIMRLPTNPKSLFKKEA